MRARVLKAFPYSPDGLTKVDLKPGAERDIADNLIEELTASGHIEPVEAAAPTAAASQQPKPTKGRRTRSS